MTPNAAATTLAARLYEGAQPALKPQPTETAGGPDLAGLARSFADTLRQGEETAVAGLAGKADAQSVVTALAASEVAIQTAVTLRDKVVEAYNEILRMPV